MKLFLLLFLCSLSNISSAQPEPVKWSFELGPLEDGLRTVTCTATIEDGWYLYSQHTDPEGPIATSFAYEGGETVGATEEVSDAISEYSELFEVNVVKFKHKAIFTQKIKPKAGESTIKVNVRFMTCDGNKCLPPTDVLFEMAL